MSYVVVRYDPVATGTVEFLGVYRDDHALQGYLTNFTEPSQHSVEASRLPSKMSEGVKTIHHIYSKKGTRQPTPYYILELA